MKLRVVLQLGGFALSIAIVVVALHTLATVEQIVQLEGDRYAWGLVPPVLSLLFGVGMAFFWVRRLTGGRR
jgi:hypothetical protein